MDIAGVTSNSSVPVSSGPATVPSAPSAPPLAAATDTVTLSAPAQKVATDVPAAPLDLSGKDLRQTDLKALDLRHANLSGANLSGMDLSGLDFSGANLTNADLSNVTAENTDFSGSHIEDTKLSGGSFVRATFDNALMTTSDLGTTGESLKAKLIIRYANFAGASFKDTAMQRVAFQNSSAVNADFSGMTANAAISYAGEAVSFTGTDLSGANFDQASGAHLTFSQCNLTDAKLTNLSLSYDGWTEPPTCLGITASNLQGTKFSGTSFDMTALTSVDLTKADLTGMTRSALGSTIADSNIAGLDFSGFDFTGSRIDGQDQNASASNANLSLKGTNFEGANFTYATFANCSAFQTKGVNVTGAIFRQTLVDDLNKSVFSGQSGTLDAKSESYDPAEGWIETLNKLGLDSSATRQSYAAAELVRFCTDHGATDNPVTSADAPAAVNRDIDKALTTLKDYAAGKGEKTDADKALAILKSCAKANVGNASVLTLVKHAAAESQKFIQTRASLDHGKTVANTAPAKAAATGTKVSLTA